MAVIVNKNTLQGPMADASNATVSGSTGVQSIKWMDAPRVYIKTADATATPVTAKSNGVTPTGWTDLGSCSGSAKITYTKELTEIRTGIDNYLRQEYVRSRSASAEVNLNQFDDYVVAQVLGQTPATITSGSSVRFAVGGEDVLTKALLLVSQNKIDGKEWQLYSPGGDVTFNIGQDGDFTVLNLRVSFVAFKLGSVTPATASGEALFLMTSFA